jgi:hypothetical protein
MAQVTSSLQHILQSSYVAWYKDDQGRTAYFENAVTTDIPGRLLVNGKHLTGFIIPKIDLSRPYQAHKNFWNDMRQLLSPYGIPLESGWTCQKETSGMELHEACKQSLHFAARNEDGKTVVQYLDTTQLAFFIDGKRFWTIDLTSSKALERVLSEFGVVAWMGWIPSRIDLLALYERKHEKTIEQH